MNLRPLAALAVAAALTATLTGAASAHEYHLGALQIGHPFALETPASATTGAGYLSITNTGATGDRLIEVRTSFPRAQIHATEIDAKGVARMVSLDGLDIPAGATVTLTPGGMHVMFMGIGQPFTAGGHIPATLVFAKAGSVDVDFHIQPRNGAADDADMDAMPGMTH